MSTRGTRHEAKTLWFERWKAAVMSVKAVAEQYSSATAERKRVTYTLFKVREKLEELDVELGSSEEPWSRSRRLLAEAREAPRLRPGEIVHRAVALLLLLACGRADSADDSGAAMRRYCPEQGGAVTCGADGRLWVCSLAPAADCSDEIALRARIGEPDEGLSQSCMVWSLGVDLCP